MEISASTGLNSFQMGQASANQHAHGVAKEAEDKASKGAAAPKDETQLSADEKKQVDELKARDREVRAHEAAHLAAAGQYAQGGPSFSYQGGPDGKNYAVGGEVQIDTSVVAGDPEATLRKMQAVQAAASAPADPSAQDRSVAASAAQTAAAARADLQKEQTTGDAQEGNTDALAEQQKASEAYSANASQQAISELIDLTA